MHSFKVAVIGLGAMGLPVAENLGKKLAIQAWNRSPEIRCKNASGLISQVTDLKEVDAEIILTFLPDDVAVFETLKKGLLKSLQANDLLVVMGTVSPTAMLAINAVVGERGARAIDAPVSGGDAGAKSGELSIMVGASRDDFLVIQPILALIGKLVKHVGALGSGQALKACNQIIVGANLLAIAEALSLSRQFNIEDKDFFDVISNGLAGSTALNVKWEKLSTSNFSQGGKSQYQLKDLRIALAAAESLNFNLPLTQLLSEIFRKHVESGNSELDHSSIILKYQEDTSDEN
jgi:2-hydroxy-3-oxopropionate reductase